MAILAFTSIGTDSTPSASALWRLGPGERRCFAVGGTPGGAALVNLTPVEAFGSGNGQLVGSHLSAASSASNVNFAPNSVDPNVAFAAIGPDQQVCYVNSQHTSLQLVADYLGTISAAAFQPSGSGAASRVLDTRSGARLAPGQRVCFPVTGTPGDAAVVNVTPIDASGPGNGQLISSDVNDPPAASNVNFRVGSVDPNVAIATIGSDGTVCFVNSPHSAVHVVADHLGSISSSAFQAAQPDGAPRRALETRGGPRIEPNERRCFAVAGTPGDAAVVNLTPVEAVSQGNGQLISSDVIGSPAASNVNFQSGSVDPNVAVAPIGLDGQVCYVNSRHSAVHLIADHLGTIAAASFQRATSIGAPVRALDTRTETPPVPPTPPPGPTTPAGNCHPSYPTVCIPPAPPDLDCGDIPYRNFAVRGTDPHRFDGDNDGIGCER